jgi:hypothetical protein
LISTTLQLKAHSNRAGINLVVGWSGRFLINDLLMKQTNSMKTLKDLRNTLDNTLDNTNEKDLRKYNNSYLFTSNVYSNEFKLDCNVKIDLDSWNDLYLFFRS